MKWYEQADLLLCKAGQDEYLLDRMVNDPDAPIEAFGFHAQQAVEKLLKAMLSLHQIEYPWTHRLGQLMDLSRDSGVTVPEEFDELRLLTPFAVEFRYDPIPEEPEAPVDKALVRKRIGDLRAWVESFLKAAD